MVSIQRVILIILIVLMSACSEQASNLPEQRILVLGVDGMDYAMTSRLMAEGRMPNFTRLSQQGQFQALETSVPPLSPVAWSDFMTGMDAGGHGIYDFLHRDPARVVPEFAMSKTEPPSHYLSLGAWQLPLTSGRIINQRKGDVFWQDWQEQSVTSTIMRMPANYPPVGAGDRELTGMGTPDLLGSYGIFTFITTRTAAGPAVDGGEIQQVEERDGVITALLKGPPNPFQKPSAASPLELPVKIMRDSSAAKALITLDGHDIRLHAGEWTAWVPVEFDPLPWLPAGPGVFHGMVRFYLKAVSPELELYVSPINFDPLQPDTILSEPVDFAAELAAETGRFYTQGLPVDTKVLEAGLLNKVEFFQQAALVAQETMAQLELTVTDFLAQQRSFLFYYLGHLDQVSHILWKSTDPLHPNYDPDTDPEWAALLEKMYVDIDTLVGRLAERLGTAGTLIVMSDHGFAPWRRELDLNGWLREQGYLVLKPGYREGRELFADVDWSRTRAYGVGFNGLYLNLAGREREGIVNTADKAWLLEELTQELLALVDPATGEKAISRVYRPEDYYQDQGMLAGSPDLIIGYSYGTRVASRSALGAVASRENIFRDNTSQWSGDHSMDHEAVPGILLTSQPLPAAVTSLRDLTEVLKRAFSPDG